MSAPIPGFGAPSHDTEQWQTEDGTVHPGAFGRDRHLDTDDADEQFRSLMEAAEDSGPDPEPVRELSGQRATRPKFRDAMLRLSQLDQLPPIEPLVDGLLYRGQLAQLAGAPGSYKSFVAVGMACSVAAGIPFEGHAVHPGGGLVLYVAAEGASGLQARMYAWCELAGVDPATVDDRLITLPLPVQLGNRVDVAEAIELAAELRAELVVIDTRARCTRGLEENSNTAQEPAISAAEAFTTEAGSAVLVVHHLGRNGLTPRGANAWDGAVWSDLRLKSDYLRTTVHCEKHKDVPDGCDHDLRLIPHTVSQHLMPDASEKARQTLVAVAGDGRPEPEETRGSASAVLSIVKACDGAEGLTRSQLVNMAIDAGVGKTQAYTAVKDLAARGRIRNIATGKIPRYVLGAADLFAGEESA